MKRNRQRTVSKSTVLQDMAFEPVKHDKSQRKSGLWEAERPFGIWNVKYVVSNAYMLSVLFKSFIMQTNCKNVIQCHNFKG